MLSYIGYGMIGLGAILILIGVILMHRKAEAEISRSLTQSPMFVVGCVVGLIGFVIKIVDMFM